MSKGYHSNAMKVWEGPSQLDGRTIMVIATGLRKNSLNSKTGNMVQTWVLLKGVSPSEAVKTGEDSSVCGQCPLRPFLKAQRPDYLPRPCYVKTWQAPRAVWGAHHDREVSDPEVVRARIAGRKVRKGSYGDPAAVPSHVWEMLQSTPKDTGYTHQWETAEKPLTRSVMASVHTVKEAMAAWTRGFRTFRVVRSVDERIPGKEIVCPASKEAGVRTTCAECGLCNGSQGDDDRRKNIVIVAH